MSYSKAWGLSPNTVEWQANPAGCDQYAIGGKIVDSAGKPLGAYRVFFGGATQAARKPTAVES